MVTVVTPTLSARNRLLKERCYPSITAQTFRDLEWVIELDEPPSGDWGVSARLRALARARFDLIAYLDDDNEYLPDHLSSLVALIEETGADFVYSDDNRGIGNGQPQLGHIDTSTILHRRELLDVATWRPSGLAADWDLVERWLAAGATWAYSGLATTIYHPRSEDPTLA